MKKFGSIVALLVMLFCVSIAWAAPETGETISALPDEPAWTEQVLDEGGQPIGEQTVMVGRFAR